MILAGKKVKSRKIEQYTAPGYCVWLGFMILNIPFCLLTSSFSSEEMVTMDKLPNGK